MFKIFSLLLKFEADKDLKETRKKLEDRRLAHRNNPCRQAFLTEGRIYVQGPHVLK